MKFHAPTKQFTVSQSDLAMAAHSFEYVIRHIRELANLPMSKYSRDGALTSADHAQKGILDAAKALGIDMGAEWGNELDVSYEDERPKAGGEQ
ncbi:MAG TPA: hypothetical protein DCF82_23095 [Marinobacter hydrocarbonoclasticus]|uniref:Uncharacterized protein n=1 Tax=Marinobacter nauticus TaxID=2743 RepID=A0A3B8WNH7_MARNT|nr:hypothetical protein [Marinobacter nauticus]